MSNSDNSPKLPWLNDEFVGEVLKADLNDEGLFKIVKYNCESSTKSGDNYSSSMYRLNVVYTIVEKSDETYSKSYIIKNMFSQDTDMGKFMKILNVFKLEAAMYSKSIPAMEDAFKSVKTKLNMSPKLLYLMQEPHELLVMEDLQASGFKMLNRMNGMDKLHCEMVFTKLGLFHAASMFLNKKDSHFRDLYCKGALNKDMPQTMIDYVTNGILQALDVMRRIPDCQKYIKTYEAYSKRVIKSGIELLTPVPKDCFKFNVLNHGDLWINNMMFKYDDEGKPIDLRVVDYQMCFFGNPGLDINYFFTTSLIDETRELYRDHILSVYHKTLVDTLNSWGYDEMIPTFDDLKDTLLVAKDIAIMTPCIVLPLVKMDPKTSTSVTTDDIMSNENETKSDMYNNKLYEDALVVALKHLEKIGFIEGDED